MCHATSMFHQQRNLKCLLAGRRSQLEILRNMENITIDDEIINACNEYAKINKNIFIHTLSIIESLLQPNRHHYLLREGNAKVHSRSYGSVVQ